MSDGVGLSIGATRLAAVVVGRAALTRTSVLTRFPHRPPEVGVPSENPNLNERGLILTDFVDRVGDPVGIVAADGSTHRADGVLADALARTAPHAHGGQAAGRAGRCHISRALASGGRRGPAQRAGRGAGVRQPRPRGSRLRCHRSGDGVAGRPGRADPRRHRAVRLRRHRYEHHARRRRRGLRAARPDRSPHRSLRRSRRPGIAHPRDQRSVGRRKHRPVRHVGDRIAHRAAGPVPRRQGAAVH